MKTVAALIFESMAPLDLFGPIQVFNAACTPREEDSTKPDTSKPLYRVIFVGKEKGLVATGSNGAGRRWWRSTGSTTTLILTSC